MSSLTPFTFASTPAIVDELSVSSGIAGRVYPAGKLVAVPFSFASATAWLLHPVINTKNSTEQMNLNIFITLFALLKQLRCFFVYYINFKLNLSFNNKFIRMPENSAALHEMARSFS
jgi:hypothetical protein